LEGRRVSLFRPTYGWTQYLLSFPGCPCLHRSLAIGTKSGYKLFSLSSVEQLDHVHGSTWWHLYLSATGTRRIPKAEPPGRVVTTLKPLVEKEWIDPNLPDMFCGEDSGPGGRGCDSSRGGHRGMFWKARLYVLIAGRCGHRALNKPEKSVSMLSFRLVQVTVSRKILSWEKSYWENSIAGFSQKGNPPLLSSIKVRLLVCLEESIYIHNIKDMKLLKTILDIPPNPTGEIVLYDGHALGTVIRVFSVPDGQKLYEFRRGMKRYVTISSLAFSMDSQLLCASSNTETVHIFKLEHLASRERLSLTLACALLPSQPEEPSTWTSYVGKMFMAATNYLPTQVSDMMNQDRAFATGRLGFSGHRNICTLSTIQKLPRLLVASSSGHLYIYNLDPQDGGDCVLIKTHSLLGSGTADENKENDLRPSLPQSYAATVARPSPSAASTVPGYSEDGGALRGESDGVAGGLLHLSAQGSGA
ncbi:hypothetical protein E2I00_018512, partial [Balaenoptera physalus]